MLRRIQQTLLIDRTLFYALAARIWQAFSGLVTVSLIIASLTASETGIYYSLGAIVGIQVFFDLGLLNVLISQAGYAISTDSNLSSKSTSINRNDKHVRMAELIRVSERWFFGASLLFGISALVLGWAMLGSSEVAIDWKSALVALVVLSSASFALTPSQAILEGAGKRELIYRIRFYQAVTGSLAFWIALSTGLKLWSLVVSAAVQVGWMAYLRFGREANFFSHYRQVKSDSTQFSWLRDIVPVQWRLAVWSLAYFMATQFFVLIILFYDSEISAGQLGMTLSIVNAIQMSALAWVQTNFSTAAIQHGSGNRQAAGTHWRKLTAVSTSILVVALSSLFIVIWLLPSIQRGYEDRFVSPSQLAIYSLGCLANHIIAIQSFYVLSQCARPLMLAAVIGFLTTAFAVWVGGATFAITGLLTGFTFAMVLICLPLHTYAYLRFRRRKMDTSR